MGFCVCVWVASLPFFSSFLSFYRARRKLNPPDLRCTSIRKICLRRRWDLPDFRDFGTAGKMTRHGISGISKSPNLMVTAAGFGGSDHQRHHHLFFFFFFLMCFVFLFLFFFLFFFIFFFLPAKDEPFFFFCLFLF